MWSIIECGQCGQFFNVVNVICARVAWVMRFDPNNHQTRHPIDHIHHIKILTTLKRGTLKKGTNGSLS